MTDHPEKCDDCFDADCERAETCIGNAVQGLIASDTDPLAIMFPCLEEATLAAIHSGHSEEEFVELARERYRELDAEHSSTPESGTDIRGSN